MSVYKAKVHLSGVTMIYAPSRNVDLTTVENYITLAKEVMDAHPGFFMGFDLVGKTTLNSNLYTMKQRHFQARRTWASP